MSMSAELIYGLVGAFGAMIQEVFHLYERREKLDFIKKSLGYWSITTMMILVSGVGTSIWFYGQTPTLQTCLVMGAGFPLIFKKAVGVITIDKRTHLGDEDLIQNYFL